MLLKWMAAEKEISCRLELRICHVWAIADYSDKSVGTATQTIREDIVQNHASLIFCNGKTFDIGYID